jgi:hypothetical protein
MRPPKRETAARAGDSATVGTSDYKRKVDRTPITAPSQPSRNAAIGVYIGRGLRELRTAAELQLGNGASAKILLALHRARGAVDGAIFGAEYAAGLQGDDR